MEPNKDDNTSPLDSTQPGSVITPTTPEAAAPGAPSAESASTASSPDTDRPSPVGNFDFTKANDSFSPPPYLSNASNASSSPPPPPDSSVAAPLPPAAPKSKKKFWLIITGATAGVLLLAAGAVFGLVLPNTPQNIWKSGLNRTGEAIEKLVEESTTAEKLATFKTTDMQGTVNVTLGEQKFSGTLRAKYDDKSLDGGLSFTMDVDGTDQTVSLDALSTLPDGSLFPDMYFRFAGLEALGLDAYVPGIGNYENSWIYVSSDELEALSEGFVPSEDSGSEQVTAADVAEVSKALTKVTGEYIFTDDPAKAVLEQRSFVGKETIDDIKTNHYTVGVNTAHAVDYCVALAETFYSTQAYARITGATDEEIAKAKSDAAESCRDTSEASSSDADETFDMWVDRRTKLIHKIRITDPDNSNSYFELGQKYTGDKLTVFARYHEEGNVEGEVTIDMDFKANSVKINVSTEGGQAEEYFSVKAMLEMTATDAPVTIEVPKEVITIEEFLSGLGYNFDTGVAGGIQSRAEDTERRTDINALQAQVEAYYARNGTYPSLSQINDSAWRNANMQGLNEVALIAPGGTSAQLATTATASQYGYTASSDGGTYSLTALLSDGTTYQKQSWGIGT